MFPPFELNHHQSPPSAQHAATHQGCASGNVRFGILSETAKRRKGEKPSGVTQQAWLDDATRSPETYALNA